MTCSDGFLVDNRTDVESLCHTHIVEVFHECDSLPHSQPLGCETGKDIRLGAVGECHEGLGVSYSFLHKQSQVAPVAVYHHAVGVTKQRVEFLASLLVLLDDFHIHIVGHCQSHPHRSLSATHDDAVLHVGIVLLAHQFAYIRDILLGSHEVCQVTVVQFVVTTWDDGLSTTLQCHNMIWVVRSAKQFNGLVEYLACLAQFYTEHHQCPSMHIPSLPHPTEFQGIDDIGSSKHLGIDKRVDTEFLEKWFEFRVEILIVVYSRYCLLRSNTVCYYTCVHVAALIGSDAHKKVGILHPRRLKILDTRRRALHSHYVIVAVEPLKATAVIVHQRTVLMFLRQQFC